MNDPLLACRADGCAWDTRGTAHGSPPPLCRGEGGPARCLTDALEADPFELVPASYRPGP